MKNKLIISLTLLAVSIIACGGLTTQLQPQPASSTQAVTQPNQVATSSSVATELPTIESAKDVPAPGVSFAKDVEPILVNSCNDCHGGRQIKEGLDLRTYEGVMTGSFNGTVLIPGNSADSLLVQQLINGKMPKRGAKLTPAQIKIISNWIDAGASNN